MYRSKQKKSAEAQLAARTVTGLTILSNLIISPEAPARSRAGTSGENGGSNAGILQMPYIAGPQQQSESGSEFIPANENLSNMQIPENNMDALPDHILSLVDDMERQVNVNTGMAASVSTEAGISGSQAGVNSQASQPRVQQFHDMPSLLSPLSDDDVITILSSPTPPKKTSLLSLNKEGPSHAVVPSKRPCPDVEELPSTSGAVTKKPKRNEDDSLLKKELLKPPQIKTQKTSEEKTRPQRDQEGLVKSAAEETVTASVTASATPPHQQRGLGAGQKRIQMDAIVNHESDSDSDCEVFSQFHYRHAYKIFKRALSEMRKRKEEALDAVREADEELQVLEDEQRRLDERRARAVEKKTTSQQSADNIEMKLVELSEGLGMRM